MHMNHAYIAGIAGVVFFGAAAIGAKTVILATQINTACGRREAEPRCPACGVRNARASSQRALWDYFFQTFSCYAFRCRQCAARFYSYVDRPA